MTNTTADLIAKLTEQARLADSYTRTEILKRVDVLIKLYEQERLAP